MNKVVIIGNGFDLAHNLKTSYSDFIIWYFNKILTNLSKGIDYKDPLVEIITTTRVNSNTFESQEDIVKFLEFLKSIDQINFKINDDFFKRLLSNFMTSTWVDIEATFYSQLITHFKFLQNNPNSKPSVLEKVNCLNNQLEFLHKELRAYLSSTILNNDEIVNNEILEKLNKELTSNDYKDSVLFVVFNYTNTIDFYKKFFSHLKPDVIYIHGQLNKDNNPTIFGYGDEMDTHFRSIELLNENLFLKNMKTFQYHRTNNYKSMLGFLVKAPFEVILMGHSCGLSDRILLNKIFEHEKCKSIKLFYHKKSYVKNDFKEKMFEIYRHFSTDKKDLMLERMVSFENSIPLIG